MSLSAHIIPDGELAVYAHRRMVTMCGTQSSVARGLLRATCGTGGTLCRSCTRGVAGSSHSGDTRGREGTYLCRGRNIPGVETPPHCEGTRTIAFPTHGYLPYFLSNTSQGTRKIHYSSRYRYPGDAGARPPKTLSVIYIYIRKRLCATSTSVTRLSVCATACRIPVLFCHWFSKRHGH